MTELESDEIETTRAEKLLAVVLAVFMLVGGIWIYTRLDFTHGSYAYVEPTISATDTRALRHEDAARARLAAARRADAAARQQLVLRREAYRTALEAHQPADRLATAYRQAQARLNVADARVANARAQVAAARPAAAAAQAHIDAAQRRASAEAESRSRHDRRTTFLLRLAYTLATLAGAFWLLHHLRRRRSRYQVAGLAAVGFATVQAFVAATDYLTDYIDVQRLGPLVLSLAGIALTIVSLVVLQRYVRRRIPLRRIRKRECPFCGFPAGPGTHCEGCGRQLVAECAQCAAPRRIGTPHCAACGSA